MPEFKGWDWGELSDALGVEEVRTHDPMADNELRLEHTRAVIDEAAEGYTLTKDSERADQVYQLCRQFLEALVKEEEAYGYNDPVWRGILAVDDRWTFLQWMSHCLAWMWT